MSEMNWVHKGEFQAIYTVVTATKSLVMHGIKNEPNTSRELLWWEYVNNLILSKRLWCDLTSLLYMQMNKDVVSVCEDQICCS